MGMHDNEILMQGHADLPKPPVTKKNPAPESRSYDTFLTTDKPSEVKVETVDTRHLAHCPQKNVIDVGHITDEGFFSAVTQKWCSCLSWDKHWDHLHQKP